MTEAIRISLKDYVLSGGGFNGESYFHRDDPTVMLKLYFPGKIQQPLDEMTLSRKVYEMGIPTPEPGEYVVMAQTGSQTPRLFTFTLVGAATSSVYAYNLPTGMYVTGATLNVDGGQSA